MKTMTVKQKQVHYGRVAAFLKWLYERNGIVLAKEWYIGVDDRRTELRPLKHKEIERLMSQFSGTKLTISIPMSEEE
jgi:hypothetical protein